MVYINKLFAQEKKRLTPVVQVTAVLKSVPRYIQAIKSVLLNLNFLSLNWKINAAHFGIYMKAFVPSVLRFNN